MENVSKDEQRHIGFGVKMISDLVQEDPECRDAIADLLREVMPMSVGVFVPPNWDMRYIETFGSTMLDVYEQGMQSLEQKLRSAGVPFESLDRKSTRLNSSHANISYAVFCLKKKKK